jgi:2-polyprenyl-3-methyl-5-hydroxy-6-metoxy-1,4-benzoquinol methylase
MKCRFCRTEVSRVFLDLGQQPSANSFIDTARKGEKEPVYPLKVLVCEKCLLVQLADVNKADDIFTAGYVYFSSYAKSWVEHAKRYADKMTERFSLGAASFVVEVASNDGYLLQHFKARDIECLGIDPAANAAEAAKAKGVETLVDFFGEDLARKVVETRGKADVIAANNVLAHVPELNDFVRGLKALLKPGGVITIEFPHLMQLVEGVQFDTIYDEHFSYFSLGAAQRILSHHGLEIFDVEELPTHGGSLRLFIHHQGDVQAVNGSVEVLLSRERNLGMESLDYYDGFQNRTQRIRDDFLEIVTREKAAGRKIAAFGAAAKGNTFLNYCKVGVDAIDFVVDDTPAKQGKLLPMSRIPVVSEEVLKQERPDIILVLPWNLKGEIINKLAYIRDWGGRFVTCIPEVEVS